LHRTLCSTVPQATARLVAEQTVALDPLQCTALEELLWPQGRLSRPSVTALLPGSVRRRLPRLIATVTGATDSQVTEQRSAAARAERGIWCEAGPDDNATITAVLSTIDAAAVLSALDAQT
jgi:hypothetical protein